MKGSRKAAYCMGSFSLHNHFLDDLTSQVEDLCVVNDISTFQLHTTINESTRFVLRKEVKAVSMKVDGQQASALALGSQRMSAGNLSLVHFSLLSPAYERWESQVMSFGTCLNFSINSKLVFGLCTLYFMNHTLELFFLGFVNGLFELLF